MKALPTPKNEYAMTIWLLIKYKETGFSMKEACQILFYKVQSRLGEIEKSFDSDGKPRSGKLKIRRLRMNKKNRFGNSMSYMTYKSLASVGYLKNLLSYLNKNGLK